MKPLLAIICIALVLDGEFVKCDPREIVKELSKYPIEKSIILALNQTVVIVMDSSKEERSLVYLARYRHHKQTIDDITSQYFKGHVNEFVVQPQKQLGIFTETGLKHIVVLFDEITVVPKVYELKFVPSRVSIPENNYDGKFFIIHDKAERKIYFTQTGGEIFQLLTDNVVTFDWQYDGGKNFLLVERRTSPADPSSSLEYIELTPRFNKHLKLVTLADQVRDFSINGHFIFIHRANDTLLYYKRQKFIRTFYYPVFRIHNIHLVDTENNSIKVIAENDQESRFYIGNYYINSSTIRFELSLMNIEKDYLAKIESVDGVYIATQNNASKSVITHDNGRTWNETDINVVNNKIFSSKLVPGVVAVAIGNSFMISQDGGRSWYRTVEANHSYAFNNMLGIIVGIDMNTPTMMLKYSVAYGKPWASIEVYEKLLTNHALYSNEETMDFYILAHDHDHNNYLTRIDFKPMFMKPCDEYDYTTFTTDVCILGQKAMYRRRNGLCYPDHDATVKNNELCDCSFGDYDCDTNYARTHLSMECKLVPGVKIVEGANCRPGELFQKSRGYQKIEASLCTENYKSLYTDQMALCPYKKVDYLVAKTNNMLKMYDENLHQIKSLNGYRSRDSYEFDLLDTMMFETNHTVIKQHSINKNTHGRTLIHESVTIRNLNYDWISGWLFYIVKPPLTIRAFPVRATNTNHSKVVLESDAVTRITSLTIHVIQKLIYWRDGNDFKYAILKFNPDNSDIVNVSPTQVLLKGQTIGSDLVVDYISDRLYYYSTMDGNIMNCDLFGLHCGATLKVYSDYRDLTPTNAYQIAVSHMYIYFYDPEQKTVQYWSRSKEYTDAEASGQTHFDQNIHDVTEMKFFSKSIQLYTKCLVEHRSAAMCQDVLYLDKPSNVLQTPIITEMVCPNSAYCDGVFDCFYGEDEEYCIKGPEEVVQGTHHKLYWIGIVVALGVISFMVASLLLLKRARRSRFTGARYNVVENRVLINEEELEDDESDIEMLFN